MEFRKTNSKEVEEVLKIYKDSSDSLKSENVDQWQEEGPGKKSLLTDMEMEYSYVLADDTGVKGTTALIFDGEVTYDLIFNGNWINEEEYCTIHRFAVSVEDRSKGIASKMMEEIEVLCMNSGVYNIKVDTHEDNFKMRNFLEKNNFVYCGKIFLQNGDLRVAYQKVINE